MHHTKKFAVNGKGKKIRIRKIYKRNIVISILSCIFSFGIYGYFWQYEIDKETKSITKYKKGLSSSLVVFLSIITCGIYTYFWAYGIGKKHRKYLADKDINKQYIPALYLVISLSGLFLGLIFSIFSIFTFGDAIVAGLFIPVFTIIFGFWPSVLASFAMYAYMQSNMNTMLEQSNEEIYCRDSSIFNKAILSTLFLYIAGGFPTSIQLISESLLIEKDPASIGSGVESMIKQSAEEVIKAGNIDHIIVNLLTIISAVLVLWWFALRFKHAKYDGVLKLENLGKALLLMLPVIGILCGIDIIGYIVSGSINFNIGIIILGFLPGFVEEVQDRGMIVPNLMRVINKKSGIWIAIVVSSLIFGITHMGNALVGANIGMTIYQVFYATALGVVFAAVLLRTGNLWASIIAHGCIDTLAFMSPESMESGAVLSQAFELNPMTIVMIIVYCAFIVYGIWLCRPKKHDEILSLWCNKFGDAMLEPLNEN